MATAQGLVGHTATQELTVRPERRLKCPQRRESIILANILRMPVFAAISALCGFSLFFAGAGKSSDFSQAKQEEPTLQSVLALKDPFLQGNVKTYYTPGFQKRAETIRDFLVAERTFYEEKLGITVPLTIAVLDAKQWQALNILDPYAMPT